ncbi:uncharacterized protein LOC142617820 [Castanea sativa]|uniref:uncharacterized protein LOC142617820 n=1 Tax=Castanea sativa TaxID=21020 RepID=UPI003F64CC41
MSTQSASTSTAAPAHPKLKLWEISSSPYFLPNSDNPGMTLMTQPLTEENYNTWSRSILVSLDAKSKLGFIDGSIPKHRSESDPSYIAWCKCNSIVLAWLFNSLTKDIQASVIYFKSAREVWLDLLHRYSQGNGPRIFELRKAVSSLAQEDSSLNAYYTRFKGVWDEFSNYWTCTCGHQDEECTMAFFMGLNEIYAGVRGQILLMDPVPPLSKVFSLLLQDEKQRKVGSGHVLQSESAALVSKTANTYQKSTSTYGKSKNGRPQCTHCGLMGHVVDKCYKLHGYPPGYKSKGKGQASANSVAVSATDHMVDDNVSLTRIEYQQLLSLFNSQAHFGTQGPQELASGDHQVANIIAQPTMGFAGHEMSVRTYSFGR